MNHPFYLPAVLHPFKIDGTSHFMKRGFEFLKFSHKGGGAEFFCKKRGLVKYGVCSKKWVSLTNTSFFLIGIHSMQG